MAVGIPKVDASSSTTVVNLPVLQGPRPTPIRDTSGLNTVEHRIEFRVIHMKGIVMTLEPLTIVEVQGQGLIDPHGCKVPHGTFIRQAKDVGKKPCRGFFVVNGVLGQVHAHMVRQRR